MKWLEKLGIKEKEVPRGAPEGATEVDIQYIVDIFNYENASYVSLTALQYADWVNNKIKDLEKKLNVDLENNISISNDKDHITLYVDNLSLLVNKEVKISFGPSFSTHLFFTNNNFINDAKGFYKTILINLIGNGIINFTNNKFKKSKLNFQADGNFEERYVVIKNNEISSISALMNATIYFNQGNVINNINIERNEDKRFGIRWNAHQNIDPQEEFSAESNRKSFIILKEKAIYANDKLHEILFHREILKCERFIFKEVSPEDSRQDRFILWFGSIVSDHGVSFLRPLFLLLLINATFAIFSIGITLYEGISIEYWQWILKPLYIWFEMLNPVSSLANSTGITDNIFISTFNAVQKGAFALLVYEMIRVGRRFTLK